MSYRLRPFLLIRTASLVALPLVIGACRQERGPLQVQENSFTWSGVVAPGKTVRIREVQGNIDVLPTTGDTVRITARTEWRRGDPSTALKFTATQPDGDLLICAIWGTGTCTADKYNASIRLGKSGGTDAKVYFQVELPAGVELDLVNINGDISAASSARVRARTVNGDVRVATAVGPVTAETLNGSVDVRMSSISGTDTVEAKTMNGDAFVYLPSTTGIALDMSVTNGSLSSDFPVTMPSGGRGKSLKTVIGDGAHPVRIRTMNGEVALRLLDAEGKSGTP